MNRNKDPGVEFKKVYFRNSRTTKGSFLTEMRSMVEADCGRPNDLVQFSKTVIREAPNNLSPLKSLPLPIHLNLGDQVILFS